MSLKWAALSLAGASALFAGRAPAAPSTAESTTQPSDIVDPPDYASFTQSVTIPFTRQPDFDKLAIIHVRISVNGGPPMNVQVDTGSVGVILGASDVPGVEKDAPTGSITYSSSGVEMDGVWTNATIRFVDAVSTDGKPVETHVPVLAAQVTRNHPGAVNSAKKTASGPATVTVSPKAPHPHMFGIAFGRGPEGHPERNPFLNLTAMQAGTMRRGYEITRDGYQLGLTAQNAGSTEQGSKFYFEKLMARQVSADSMKTRPELKDWYDPRGTLTVGNQPPMPTGFLLDTGLTNFMIEVPTTTDNTDVPDGTVIKCDLMGGGKLGYSFTVGDKSNPAAPRRTSYTHREKSALVNTGLKAFANFDYLFDEDGGYFGLRPTRPAAEK